jgi:hypothetical protein
MSIFAFSCSKSDDADPVPTPKYPQFVGTWQGLTTQNDTVLFEVNSSGATLNLKRYKYTITCNESGYYSRTKVDMGGQTIPFISDNQFAFNNGLSIQDSITGNFDITSSILSGTISKEFTSLTSQKYLVKVAYTASKQ